MSALLWFLFFVALTLAGAVAGYIAACEDAGAPKPTPAQAFRAVLRSIAREFRPGS